MKMKIKTVLLDIIKMSVDTFSPVFLFVVILVAMEMQEEQPNM